MSIDDQLRAIVRDAVREALLEAPQKPGALTLAAAAKYAATSPETLKKLLDSGELTGLRVGQEWRIGVKVLDALLARGATVETSAK